MSEQSKFQETAANLAAAWRGTEPMNSRDEVRAAVEAFAASDPIEYVEAVTDALLPLLRRDGTLR